MGIEIRGDDDLHYRHRTSQEGMDS